MATESVSTDMGAGLALVFAAITIVGVGFMLAGGSQMAMAGGFAAAMLAAVLAITALHVYEA